MFLRFLIFLLLAMTVSDPVWAVDLDSTCVRCHGDRDKMRRLGAEAMYLDPVRVDAEIGMAGVPTCSDCHLGDPAAESKERAHRGMLAPLLPGLNDARPEKVEGHVSRMFWHARDPAILQHLPKNAAKTCGKCHPEAQEEARPPGGKHEPLPLPGPGSTYPPS